MAKRRRKVIDPTRNVNALVKAGLRHEREMRKKDQYIAELRAGHAREMRQAEAARIDAIRGVDVAAVQQAAEVQAAQATALAAQVAATADAFRASLAAALAPIQASIEDLRRTQYQAQGQKTQVVESRDSSADRRLSIGSVLGGVSVALVLIFGVAGILIALSHH